jgi:cytochrome c-type biogenesis protein CcmH/NrfG
MPLTAEQFRADHFNQSEADIDVADSADSDGKLIAIVTLVLLALVVVALGLLFIRGLQTVRSSVPAAQPTAAPVHLPQSDSTGSLEL